MNKAERPPLPQVFRERNGGFGFYLPKSSSPSCGAGTGPPRWGKTAIQTSPNRETAPDRPALPLFAKHSHASQSGRSPRAHSAPSRRVSSVLTAQIPTPTHTKVLKHHFDNTRVKAATAIPLEMGLFRDSEHSREFAVG